MMWKIIAVLCCFTTVLLIIRNALLKKQMRDINRQLIARREQGVTTPVNLQLFERQLNELVDNINTCLIAEENLKLVTVREERQFRELIANVSHDLRTPLTALKSYLQLMERGALKKEQQNRLNIALRHTNNLERLIQQFFEYAYLMDAQSEPVMENICITTLLSEAIVDHVSLLEEKGIEVRFDDSEMVYAYADRKILLRMFNNLIHNGAVHAVSQLEIQIKEDRGAVITFANPIHKKNAIDVEHLFDRFYIADQSGVTTGLGLTIVKFLTEQMQGTVNATIRDSVLYIEIYIPYNNNEPDESV